MIIALMSSFILALGVCLMFPVIDVLAIAISVTIGVVIWIFLVGVYFRTCIKIYACLERTESECDQKLRDKEFNKVFSKAWFLHFYYDEPKII